MSQISFSSSTGSKYYHPTYSLDSCAGELSLGCIFRLQAHHPRSASLLYHRQVSDICAKTKSTVHARPSLATRTDIRPVRVSQAVVTKVACFNSSRCAIDVGFDILSSQYFLASSRTETRTGFSRLRHRWQLTTESGFSILPTHAMH